MSACLVDFLVGDVEAGYFEKRLKEIIGDSKSEGDKASVVKFVVLDANTATTITVKAVCTLDGPHWQLGTSRCKTPCLVLRLACLACLLHRIECLLQALVRHMAVFVLGRYHGQTRVEDFGSFICLPLGSLFLSDGKMSSRTWWWMGLGLQKVDRSMASVRDCCLEIARDLTPCYGIGVRLRTVVHVPTHMFLFHVYLASFSVLLLDHLSDGKREVLRFLALSCSSGRDGFGLCMCHAHRIVHGVAGSFPWIACVSTSGFPRGSCPSSVPSPSHSYNVPLVHFLHPLGNTKRVPSRIWDRCVDDTRLRSERTCFDGEQRKQCTRRIGRIHGTCRDERRPARRRAFLAWIGNQVAWKQALEDVPHVRDGTST